MDYGQTIMVLISWGDLYVEAAFHICIQELLKQRVLAAYLAPRLI